MIQDIQYIVFNQQYFNGNPTLFTPKSNAKDINGLSQKTIMNMINNKTKNLVKIANNFLKLLEKLKISQNSNIIIHITSRIILKKKKENIENWTDIRSLNIMPTAIMIHDKILRSIIISILHPNSNENQFGGRKGLFNTNKIFTQLQSNKK